MLNNNVLSRNEVLISCSSLRSLDLSNFGYSALKTEKIVGGKDFLKNISENVNMGIISSSKKIVDCILHNDPHSGIAERIVLYLLNRRYRRGPRNDNFEKILMRKCQSYINQNKPITFTISLFPCKIPNLLKSEGGLPDLAELLSLARLGELCDGIRLLYKHGARFIVLLDGFRFIDICNFDKDVIFRYQERLDALRKYISNHEDIVLVDYMEMIHKLPSAFQRQIAETRATCHDEIINEIGEEIDIDDAESIVERLRNHPKLAIAKMAGLYTSLMYSIDMKTIFGRDNSDNLTKRIYTNPWDINSADSDICELRKILLRKTWESATAYVAEILSGRIVKPIECIFPETIRCDMHMIPDRYTFYSVDRSTTLTPFHGTGYIDEKGQMGVKYRVQLLHSNFSPLYIPDEHLDYMQQPFCYIPSTFDTHKESLHNFILQSHIR